MVPTPKTVEVRVSTRTASILWSRWVGTRHSSAHRLTGRAGRACTSLTCYALCGTWLVRGSYVARMWHVRGSYGRERAMRYSRSAFASANSLASASVRTCSAYMRRVHASRTCVAYMRRVHASRTCVAYMRRICAFVQAPVQAPYMPVHEGLVPGAGRASLLHITLV